MDLVSLTSEGREEAPTSLFLHVSNILSSILLVLTPGEARSEGRESLRGNFGPVLGKLFLLFLPFALQNFFSIFELNYNTSMLILSIVQSLHTELLCLLCSACTRPCH